MPGRGPFKLAPTDVGKPTAPTWVTTAAGQIQECDSGGFKVLPPGTTDLPGSGVWLPLLKRELKRGSVRVRGTKVFAVSKLRSGAESEARRFLAR